MNDPQADLVFPAGVLTAGFVGAVEYFQQKFNNIRDWLFSAYQDILSRPVDDAGTSTWLEILGQL